MQNKQFPYLNWLRFFLSVYLVLFHTLKEPYAEISPGSFIYSVFDLGNMATTLFFVLSGFLLTYVYIYGRNHAPINRNKFLVTRLSALYPLHILTLLPYLPLAITVIYKLGGLEVVSNQFTGKTELLSWQQSIFTILQNITLLHAWNPSYMLFNLPSWSISALLFFYLLFPFFAPLIAKNKYPFIGLIAMGLLFSLPGIAADIFHMTDMITLGILHRNPLIRLPLFLAGIFLCSLYVRQQENTHNLNNKKINFLLDAIFLITIVTAVYIKCTTVDYNFHFINNGLYYPASLAIIWRVINISSSPSAWSTKWSGRLGKASLCIFALHYPLFGLLMRLEKLIVTIYSYFENNFNIDVSRSIISDYTTSTYQSNIYIYPFYLFIIIFISVIFQEKIINPIQTHIKKKFSSTSTVKDESSLEIGGRISLNHKHI
jgi:peptidoglycan/LPS O-acetylase OafA/YrhL